MAKVCRKCYEVRSISDYRKTPRGIGGARASCRNCESRYSKAFRETYPDKVVITKRKYYEANKEKVSEYNRIWNKENPGYGRSWGKINVNKVAIKNSARRTRVRLLPETLTEDHRNMTYKHFNNVCSLNEDISEVELEHTIPLATGHGGTTRENCVPMSASLNASKGDRNIFEWFPQVKERYGLNQRKFDELIAYLAELNGLSPKEYEDFVYWCHANPRTVEETEADNEYYGYKKPSIELWREATEGKAIS